MIVTDKFVFLHLPKTGGTFIRNVLGKIWPKTRDLYLDDRHFPKHGGVKDIPCDYRDRIILSIARNPFDHLVSFFEFQWWKLYPTDTFCFEKMKSKYQKFPDITFEEYVLSIYNWELLYPTFVNTKVAQAFETANLGVLTLDYLKFFSLGPIVCSDMTSFGPNQFREITKNIHFMRTHTLASDICDFLNQFGLSESQLEVIKSTGKILPLGSRRDQTKSWGEYCSPELKNLVRTKERTLFELFPEFDA